MEGNRRIFDGGTVPKQENRLRIEEGGMPIGFEFEGLRQGAGRGHQDFIHLPGVEDLAPAGLELQRGFELAEEVVTLRAVSPQIGALIKVSAAISEHAIVRVKLPEGVASPVVVDEKARRIMGVAQECNRSVRKLTDLVEVLMPSEI